MSTKRCVDCGTGISPRSTRCVACAVTTVHGPIDRTPKPCLHKYANHQHGTNAAYALDKCRCWPCSEARKQQDDWRRRQKAYGRYTKFVDAEPVRQHVRKLMAGGMGLKTVSKRTGVATGTLTKLIYGVYAPGPGGRNGKGELIRPPSKRILRTTADRLLVLQSVEQQPAMLAAGAPDPWRTPTARLHMRALVALGWSITELGRRLGMRHPSNAHALIHDGRTMQRATVDAIEALYAELSMTPPKPATPSHAAAATKARKYAKAHGWLPPLALEDVTDVELTQDYVDEAAVLRRLNGDRSVRLGKGETAEVVRRALDRGMTTGQIERHLGIKPERYVRLRDRRVS